MSGEAFEGGGTPRSGLAAGQKKLPERKRLIRGKEPARSSIT